MKHNEMKLLRTVQNVCSFVYSDILGAGQGIDYYLLDEQLITS